MCSCVAHILNLEPYLLGQYQWQFHGEFNDIKFCVTSSILLTWQGERRREFHGMCEEFHHHETHLAHIPSFQSR